MAEPTDYIHPSSDATVYVELRSALEECVAAVSDPRTMPHAYVSQGMNWRTCAVCGRGANARIHRGGG